MQSEILKLAGTEIFKVTNKIIRINVWSSHRRCSLRKVVLRPESEACNFIKKWSLAQAFSCEFCEISKSTFSIGHLWATASLICKTCSELMIKKLKENHWFWLVPLQLALNRFWVFSCVSPTTNIQKFVKKISALKMLFDYMIIEYTRIKSFTSSPSEVSHK